MLAIVLLATTAIYWPGLHGPFVLDDFNALRPVENWLRDDQGWLVTLFPVESIVFSRPVSMASFMLSMALGGSGPFPLKLGNLLVHLACGILVFWLLWRCLRLDSRLSAISQPLALLAATIWLLHPLHVSTVLYAVQRMAQLSTLFTLASVIIYLVGRQYLSDDRTLAARSFLFVLFPMLMLLGLLSKQNAAIAGFLCLALELAYYSESRSLPHRAEIKVFFSAFVIMPMLAAAALLVFRPHVFLAGYADWDFTLSQRLLTQPRALVDYIGMWLVPRGPAMGLYTDAYPVSIGLLSPPTTLVSLTVLTAVSAIAVAARRKAPSVFAGWFFFLAAHCVESTFLPLEMYYEHRNYLPSVGLLLAAFGALSFLFLPKSAFHSQKKGHLFLRITAFALVAVLAFSTFGRVLIWQSEDAMLAQGTRQHPESLRVKLDRVSLGLRTDRPEAAVAVLQPLLQSTNPRHRLVARMDLIAIDCWRGRDPDISGIADAVADTQDPLTLPEVHVVKLLSTHVRQGNCAQHALAFAHAFEDMLDRAPTQPESMSNKYGIRLLTAETYARAGRWQDAQRQLEIAWTASGDLPVGNFLTKVYWRNGLHDEARKVYAELLNRTRSFDTTGQRELAALRRMMAP